MKAASIIIGLISIILVDFIVFKSIDGKKKYKLYRIQLSLVVHALLFTLSRYFWRRLSPLAHSKYVAGLLWRIFLLTFFVMSQMGPIFSFYNTKDPMSVACISWICCASELLLFFVVGLLDLLCFFSKYTKVSKSFSRTDGCMWTCVIVTILYTSFGYFNAMSPPTVVRQTIPIAKLPKSMDGMTIALLSDIHLGSTVGFTMMETAVQITKALNPDIVVLAGDLTDGSVDELKEAALPLKDISAPYGSYFVTGNHEYYTSDVENWMELLESFGFHMLHNSNSRIHSKSNKNDWFCIFGTDDKQAELIGYEGHTVNLTKAFSGCDERHAAILVTHQPNIAKRALNMNIPLQLILSGHTHAGQIFPFSIPVYLGNPFYSGLYHYDSKRYVYVSQGTYFYGWPLRTGSYNEITKITLKSL